VYSGLKDTMHPFVKRTDHRLIGADRSHFNNIS
jgi:hypothetical protein